MNQPQRNSIPLQRSLHILLLIIGLILFIDGAILVLNKKIHLGTLLPLLIGAALCVLSLRSTQIRCFLAARPRLTRLWRWAWAGFGLWCISLAGFFLYIQLHKDQPLPQQPIDAIIVLGSGIIQGQASPTLALRLDRAAEIVALHPKALIIVSGGVDYGETQSEAQVMADYLVQRFDITVDQIAIEDRSTSTELNLKNSQPILAAHQLGRDARIAVVSSDFHTLRAAAIAQKQGYQQVITVSADTPLSTRYNAWLREYFAYLSGWLLQEY